MQCYFYGFGYGLARQIKERIREQAKIDVDPPLSAAAQYMRQDMTREGYRHLLAVGVPLARGVHVLVHFAGQNM